MQKVNKGKAFLRRYKNLCGLVNALNESIDDYREHVILPGKALQEKVQSSPAVHDPIASSAAAVADTCEELNRAMIEASRQMTKILNAINALPDVTQQRLLILRYIVGKKFSDIAKEMHYSEAQLYSIHAHALNGINRYLADQAKGEING